MIQHKPILTDAEMHALISGNPFTLGLSIARLKDFIRQVEKAVVAKLAEQEPIVKINCNGDTVCPKKHSLKLLDLGTKLYAHPIPNHIADASKMVFDSDAALSLAERMLSIEISEPLADELIQFARKLHEKYAQTDHIPDIGKTITPLAQRKIQSLLDKGEYRVIENATVLVNENGHAAIVNRGGAFYWVDNEGLAREFDGAGVGGDSDHIADMRKKVPEGWQLVPKEPTDAMLSCIMGSVGFESFTSWRVSASGRYMDMLATAPKFGDKQ